MNNDTTRFLSVVLVLLSLYHSGPPVWDAVTTDSFEALCEKGKGQAYHDICVQDGVVRFRREDLERWEDKHGPWEDYKPAVQESVNA